MLVRIIKQGTCPIVKIEHGFAQVFYNENISLKLRPIARSLVLLKVLEMLVWYKENWS